MAKRSSDGGEFGDIKPDIVKKIILLCILSHDIR